MDKSDLTKELLLLSHKQEVLTHQPNFPHGEDLYPENAAFLDMFLQDEVLLETYHTIAERDRRVFVLAH